MTSSLYRLWLAIGPRPPGIGRDRLLEILDPAPGERLLEIGPGAGYYTIPVARRIHPRGKLALVDCDAAILETTMRRLRSRGSTR